MESVRKWVEESPYAAALGVQLGALDGERARLDLPFRQDNSNPGDALHGGVAASLSIVGSHALTRAALGDEAGPFHTAGLQINYLAAAIGEAVTADATLLRKGKELCFCEVDVHTADGKSIAHATVAVRGRFGAADAKRIQTRGDHGESDPGPMGPHIGSVPFIGNRGISVEHMTGGASRLVMPWRDGNGDLDGGLHEGAVLALLDTTGAMASWAETGPGRYKASTPSMQAQVFGPPPRSDLVGYGRVAQRDGELFWSDVEVAGAEDARVVARGTVIYRILT